MRIPRRHLLHDRRADQAEADRLPERLSCVLVPRPCTTGGGAGVVAAATRDAPRVRPLRHAIGVVEAVGIDPNTGNLNRPTAIYSGFERKPMAASSSGSEPYTYRIPITQFPLPGSAFNLLTNKWAQMDNYCDYNNLYPV